MRVRTLTPRKKSLLAALTVAAAVVAVAVPATAAAAAEQRPTSSVAAAAAHTSIDALPLTRTVDHNAQYFTGIARDTLKSAAGKVAAPNLQVQISLLEQSKIMSPDDVRTLTDELRAMTADTAAQVAAYDAEQARLAAEAKAAAEAEAARQAAEAQAAAERAQSAPQGYSGPAGTGDNSPGAARALARSLMASNYGWGDDQFQCLDALWNRESGWNYQAANPSGAYGIPQALPGSKMGPGWQDSAAVQVTWGLGYISGRYGTPCGAWDHSQSVGWY